MLRIWKCTRTKNAVKRQKKLRFSRITKKTHKKNSSGVGKSFFHVCVREIHMKIGIVGDLFVNTLTLFRANVKS